MKNQQKHAVGASKAIFQVLESSFKTRRCVEKF